MKKFINDTIKTKLKTGQTPVINFVTLNDDRGHIQFDENSWGNDWGIFFNGKCVHTSKTLQPVINKLNKLNVTKFDLQLNEFKQFI